jgi:hypothetical protein
VVESARVDGKPRIVSQPHLRRLRLVGLALIVTGDGRAKESAIRFHRPADIQNRRTTRSIETTPGSTG